MGVDERQGFNALNNAKSQKQTQQQDFFGTFQASESVRGCKWTEYKLLE